MLTTGWYRCTSPDDRVTLRTLASGTVTAYHIEWNPVAPRHVGGNVSSSDETVASPQPAAGPVRGIATGLTAFVYVHVVESPVAPDIVSLPGGSASADAGKTAAASSTSTGTQRRITLTSTYQ